VDSYLFTSSVGVILIDAGTGDQNLCARAGQDHDEVDKALARHDFATVRSITESSTARNAIMVWRSTCS
jgi:hypothetical protein